MKTNVNKNVVVRERDFKSATTHQDIVTGIKVGGNDEFLTCSMDNSIKLWDKFTQGVSYTYETHRPLSAMQITGEKGELLVCGQGQGHLIVFGKTRRNQLSIEEWAHAEPITQIVSLSKLRNKYFATRCGDGHVNIYSSLSQPDRIAQLFNFDGDPEALAHLQPVPVVEEPVVVVKQPRSDGEEDDEEAPVEEAPPDDDEEEGKKKKKPEKQPPVAPLLVGRPEPSVRDTLIEITTKSLLQTSSTLLAVSCFNNKQVLIVNVDIKTRSKTIKEKIETKQNPTFLYQIDVDHLLIGTLGGKFEIWNIDPFQERPSIKQVFDAHPGSQ